MDSSVSFEVRGGAVCVKFRGRMGVDAANSMVGQLRQLGTSKDFVLDWKEAEHVDASALQVVLSLKKSLDVAGRTLSVEKDNPQVRDYLRISGLEPYFPLVPTPVVSGSQEIDHA